VIRRFLFGVPPHGARCHLCLNRIEELEIAMNRTVRVMSIATLVACLGWFPSVTQASGLNDAAGFFSPETRTAAEQTIQRLTKEHAVDLHIETIEALPAADLDRLKSASKEDKSVFYRKAISKVARSVQATGLVVAIWKSPGHVQVEYSPALKARGFTTQDQAKVRDALLAGFRAKEFDRGLTDALAATETIAGRLGEQVAGGAGTGQALPAAGAAGAAAPALDLFGQGPDAANPGGTSWLTVALVVVVAIVGLRLIGGLLGALFGGGGAAGAPAMGGGGGLFGSLLTGMFGAMAGHYLYDSFFSGHGADSSAFGADGTDPSSGNDGFWGSSAGGDQGGGDFGGGDGGDFGGGDF
jgi:hypothetical protein